MAYSPVRATHRACAPQYRRVARQQRNQLVSSAMARMITPDVATQTRPEDHKPPLYSVDCFTTGWTFGQPLLTFVWIAIAFGNPPLFGVFSLAGIAAWVLVDLVVYRVRRGSLPPRPVWGRHNRWVVPLFFAGGIFSTVQAF